MFKEIIEVTGDSFLHRDLIFRDLLPVGANGVDGDGLFGLVFGKSLLRDGDLLC